jgi:WD40 repeat protein
LSGGNDQTIRVWDAVKGEDAVVLKGFVNSIRGLAFHPGGQLLASGGSDHHVRAWDLEAQTQRTLRGHTDWVRSVSFSASGDRLVSTGSDRTVRIWNTASGICERVLSGHRNWVYHVASSAGDRFVTCSTDRTARMWEVTSTQGVILPTGDTGVAGYSVAISGDARLIAAGGDDHAIRVWDVATGDCRRVLREHSRLVTHLQFDSSGSTLISSGDKRALLWDLKNGKLQQVFAGHTGWVRCAVLGPDGRLAATGADDMHVRLWDCETGNCLWVGQEHDGIVFTVAFHPKGGIVASASNDETIRFWDVATGRCVRLLRNDRPYEGASIRRVTGITDAKKRSLIALGAVE